MSSWVPQVMSQPSGWSWCGSVVPARTGGGAFDGVDEVEKSEPVRDGYDGVGVRWVDAVQADDGVEMDDAAGLEFGDLAVRHADPLTTDPVGFRDASDGAFEGAADTAPEFSGGEVPDDLSTVVVAVQAQRDAEDAFPGCVDAVAA